MKHSYEQLWTSNRQFQTGPWWLHLISKRCVQKYWFSNAKPWKNHLKNPNAPGLTVTMIYPQISRRTSFSQPLDFGLFMVFPCFFPPFHSTFPVEIHVPVETWWLLATKISPEPWFKLKSRMFMGCGETSWDATSILVAFPCRWYNDSFELTLSYPFTPLVSWPII